MRFRALAVCAALLFTLAVSPARAVDPGEVLADPKQEGRARALSAELRCLVCQNQSIDDSNAPLAKDLRRLVRERITAGDTDRDVMAYIVARYGEFVLLKPPFGLHTLVLWATPLLVLGIAAAMLVRRRRQVQSGDQGAATPLTADEQRALDRLLAIEQAPANAAGRPRQS
jgi:cytochrome c-type biogenesis protein CcmH